MTPRQQQIYEFVKRYSSDHGQAPTLTEIAEATNYASHGPVMRQVNQLVDAGWLARGPSKQRNLVVAA